MFACMECDRKFKTAKSAERASYHGCPGCGGSDIDVAPITKSAPPPAKVKSNPPAPENGGTITIKGPNGEKATIPTTETGGFWYDHPDHGRIWVRVFEAK